ncbi:MAG: sulfotransferase [Pseudomonadota bacterium]
MAKRELVREDGPFNPLELIESARRDTGIDDVACLDTPGLHALCAGLAASSDQLHFIGRRRAERMVLETLVKRLRLQEYERQYGDIAQQQIERPIFLVAPFRTGTTFFHRLLAEDPAVRTTRLWEALQAPPPEPELRGDPAYFEDDYRVAHARKYIEAREKFTPELATIHPSGVDVPEECFGLLETAAMSHSFLFYGPCEEYLDWLDQCTDEQWVDAYEVYARQLRLLQWWYPGERWVLKTPFHMWAVDAILTVFPDALIVQQHRDPIKCVASYCSLTAAAYGPIMSRVDRHQVGRVAIRYLRDALARNVAARRRLPAERFIDIDYQALMVDPLECVSRVYEAAGFALTDEAQDAMRAYLAQERESHPARRHAYSLADYGLGEADVAEAFDDYSGFLGK